MDGAGIMSNTSFTAAPGLIVRNPLDENIPTMVMSSVTMNDITPIAKQRILASNVVVARRMIAEIKLMVASANASAHLATSSMSLGRHCLVKNGSSGSGCRRP